MPLSIQQQKKLKLAFVVFDKDCTGDSAGAIEPSRMQDVISAVGLSIPRDVVDEEKRKLESAGEDTVWFDDFLVIVEDMMRKHEPSTMEVREAFHAFSEGGNSLSAEALADALSENGYFKERSQALKVIKESGYDGDINKFLQSRLVADLPA